jgi:hypothetical protein
MPAVPQRSAATFHPAKVEVKADCESLCGVLVAWRSIAAMPTALKILLAVMTVWGTAFAVVALFGDLALTPPPGSAAPERSGVETLAIYLNAANAFAILVIDSYIAFNLASLPALRRVSWVFGFLFFYPVTLPAFWYLHIWRARAA